MIAPQPATKPAAGVIATRPVIMPFMAPMIDGLRKKMMSIVIQVSNDIAVQILVFKTAAPASGDAVYGSYSDNQRLDTLVRELLKSRLLTPPLKPFHPTHKMPDPIIARGMLFG
jgi:hypothetical protein